MNQQLVHQNKFRKAYLVSKSYSSREIPICKLTRALENNPASPRRNSNRIKRMEEQCLEVLKGNGGTVKIDVENVRRMCGIEKVQNTDLGLTILNQYFDRIHITRRSNLIYEVGIGVSHENLLLKHGNIVGWCETCEKETKYSYQFTGLKNIRMTCMICHITGTHELVTE